MSQSLLRRLNIRMRHLRCFVEIAQVGSTTEAARNLSTSQPAVSRTLAELEEALGVSLFDREAWGLQLSLNGRMFLADILPALEQIEKGLARFGPDTRQQTLRIGVLPSVARSFLPRVLKRFKAEHPDMLLSIDGSADAHVLERLRALELDVVLGRMAATERMRGFDFKPLYRDRLVFLVRAGHRLVRPDVTLAEICDFPLIVPPQGIILREELDRLLLSSGMTLPADVMETVSYDLVLRLLSDSDSIAFCPAASVSEDLAAGTIVALEIKNADLTGYIGTALVSGRKVTPLLKAFLALLEQEAEAWSNRKLSSPYQS